MYRQPVQTAEMLSFFYFFSKKFAFFSKKGPPILNFHLKFLPFPVPLPLTKCPPKSRQNGPPVSPTKIGYFQYVLYVRTARASSRTRQSPEKPRTRTDQPHEPTELSVRSPAPAPVHTPVLPYRYNRGVLRTGAPALRRAPPIPPRTLRVQQYNNQGHKPKA